MALDVKQAQEVQQVILPEARTMLPGLAIESEYRPAREVGGDFFQIIPHKSDGSVLIVAGDVTGKGLKAGMLVALLVGAIRSTAELNARSGSFAAGPEPAADGPRRCAGHLPCAAHCARWRGDAGQCRPYAAVSEWRAGGDGGRAAAGHVARRQSFR